MNKLSLLFVVIFSVITSACAEQASRWEHDVVVALPTETDEAVVEAYISCVDTIQPVVSHKISIQMGGVGNIQVSTLTTKEWKIKFNNSRQAVTTPELNDDGSIKFVPIRVQEKFFNEKSSNLLCHELIHAMGLFEHSDNEKDIMAEDLSKGPTYAEALSRLKALYF